MKASIVTTLAAITVALGALVPSAVRAQAQTEHLLVVPAGTPMFGYTKEETVIQLHGVGPWGLTYVNPADDPRKK